MSRGDSLARQWKLMLILEEQRQLVVPEVAQSLGYTVRTVYRDLQVLERFGVPIYQERTRGGRARWRLVEGYRKRVSLSLSWSELLALCAGRKVMRQLTGSLFHRGATSGLEKIAAALPLELRQRMQADDDRLSVTFGAQRDYSNRDQVIQTLVEAMRQRTVVSFAYRKPRSRKDEQREVEPLHLHLQQGALYLVGHCRAQNATRTFLIDRIRALSSTAERFEAGEPLDPRTFSHGIFGPWEGKLEAVHLRFAPSAAAHVFETRVHSSQQSQWTADGCLDVRMHLPVSPALLRWVMGFGVEVEVLTPTHLRTQLDARLRAMAKKLDGAVTRGVTTTRNKRSRTRSR